MEAEGCIEVFCHSVLAFSAPAEVKRTEKTKFGNRRTFCALRVKLVMQQSFILSQLVLN